MAQPITDYTAFFSGAKQAVEELDQLTQKQEMLEGREKRLESTLKAKKKALSDTIAETVRRRAAEISGSYDEESQKAEDRLKKVRAKREKAKNQGVKERIAEETQGFVQENDELMGKLKSLLHTHHVPGFCRSSYYYALYFTRGLKEAGVLLLTILICFLGIPCGIYFFLPQRKTWYLFAIYVAAVLIFGGIYVIVGNMTKMRHGDVLKEGRRIRNEIRLNRKKIRQVTRSIRKDKNEAIYNLQKFDDEMSQLDQELAQIANKKKDALNTFENVTRTIISDEIAGNYKEEIDQTETDLADTLKELTAARNEAKEKALYITDHYAIYVGKDFMTAERLEALAEFIASGQASNLSEAVVLYKSKDYQKREGAQ